MQHYKKYFTTTVRMIDANESVLEWLFFLKIKPYSTSVVMNNILGIYLFLI